jgi:hypothetical protein
VSLSNHAVSACSAVAFFLITAALIAAAEPPIPPFAAGVLRRDGVIVPFAVFDGKSWSARWPKPALDLIVPIDVGSVPEKWWGATGPRDTWFAVIGSAAPQPIKVVQPDWIDVHCVRQIGLHTDYRSDQLPPPLGEEPYPKDGLAISPSRPVEPIVNVPPAGTEANAMMAELKDAFNRAERQPAGKADHPVSRERREEIDPKIEAVYAHGTEPRAYYVEATREYMTFGNHDCQLMSFGTGWFVRENGKFRPLVMAVDVLGCDRQGASYMLPFGVVRTGTRLFWLVQFSGWASERYAVIEPKMKSVDAVVNVWGGGC